MIFRGKKLLLFHLIYSELHFFIKQRRAVHFAWLSGAGIYHGNLNFGAQHRPILIFFFLRMKILISSPNGDENFVENKALLDYTKFSEGAEAVKPRSLAISEFHYLLLIGDRVKVVNRISEQIVEELQFDHISDSVSRGIIGLCSDATAGLFYAYDENSIFQVSVHDEGRNMWQVYLDMKEYTASLAHCRDAFQRDQVYLMQADTAFSTKDFFRAASFYSKINYALSFEEITLKFISISEQDALRTFLLRKLDNLTKDDKCQITMISTWATELYLDKINRILLEDDTTSGNVNPEYQLIIKEFCAFLSDSKDVLDEATTMRLLESYGRVDELVFFASLKEHYEIVVHHYIQQGEAKKALEVLQKTSVPIDLQYKFSPDLIMLDAYETVESWMITSNLNPRRLIPAMMRYSSEPHAKNETHEVIKYLEFCVHRLLNEDTGVHNLLLSLYAKQEDDSALLRFLQCKFGKGRANGPEFFYDPKYALRLCLKEKRMRACVHIYSMMSMHEEAVALALQVDPELAMAEADKVEDDEDLRKKLWLMVAKHVIAQEKGAKRENIRKAIAFLKETDGLLKIEDILPFFPDFALIDDFKEAICSSLEDYNKQIELLKKEMNAATHGADKIRNDISALAQRYAVIECDDGCGLALLGIPLAWLTCISNQVCRRKILTVGGAGQMVKGYTSVGPMAPFYVFPCGHGFHAHCLIAHVTKCSNQAQGTQTLGMYYARLQSSWEELSHYDSFIEWSASAPSENVLIPPTAVEIYAKIMEKTRVFQFLTGLNPDFEYARVHLLDMTHFPTLEEAHTYCLSDQSRRSPMPPISGIPSETSAMAVRYAYPTPPFILDDIQDASLLHQTACQASSEAPGLSPAIDSPLSGIEPSPTAFIPVTTDDDSPAEYILDLQKQLSLLGGDDAVKDSNGAIAEGESISSINPMDKVGCFFVPLFICWQKFRKFNRKVINPLRSNLDDAIASECPFCGDLMVREISMPFVLPEESQHATSWEIKPPQYLGGQKSLPIAI
ncbi:hypothetical protein GIB67_025183 [Kingdonia uniflora]|uniref:Pep3/Vps18 beta-propeller domain-containing protein n=1 Tax=Kingdonia uniflora TaxID=39325 RepID=A0A7J7N7W9_9MAGN|nr:hypothetical protein GIB67_025183 [Kingdonia uniflora]